MVVADTLDSLFREAVAAIDAGDVPRLERLLAEHPQLVRERLQAPGAWLRDQVGNALDGFFARPYLLWFVAEDPVRNGQLPANAAQAARAVIRAAQRERVETLQEQLDYALRLVAWSWIARQCGVQLELIDALLDAGARPGETITHDALINGNFGAAARLVERGAPLTLAAALCLERWDDAARIARTAGAHDRQVALALAALHGRAEALRRLLALGVDLDAYSTDIYSHATALHHAVSSGSLDAVKVLVEAGAALGIRDRAWNGTPLDWAEHYVHEAKADAAGKPYPEIAAYLREAAAHRPERKWSHTESG
ncbi:MAG TPA: ankyrin repeat domain-containing protein [Longimicrobium sp.]|nr:ankyrin repeat domain-containing protein [Longimicrobium sp.]